MFTVLSQIFTNSRHAFLEFGVEWRESQTFNLKNSSYIWPWPHSLVYILPYWIIHILHRNPRPKTKFWLMWILNIFLFPWHILFFESLKFNSPKIALTQDMSLKSPAAAASPGSGSPLAQTVSTGRYELVLHQPFSGFLQHAVSLTTIYHSLVSTSTK